MADVTHKHPDYEKAKPVWQVCEDATGEMLDDKDRSRYILQPNPEDKSKENKARYKQYKARAVWYGFTAKTLAGMLGAAFRAAPVIENPSALDYIGDDVDGAGVGIIQQSAASLAGVLKKGRHALFVDFPESQGEISRATLKAQAIRPFIRSITAESVINWRTETVGGKTSLTLVVIAETFEQDDGFGTACEEQYRVLRLLAGVYIVEIWRKAAGTNNFVIVQNFIPKTASGSTWNEIPFFFIGSENNDSNIDPAPMFDLAQLNIAHFRNSADYEDACYMMGQPMVYMAGLSQQWVDMLEKKGIYFGSRAILPLPENGSAGMLQPEPNTMPMEAMKHKEEQAVSLGARLVEQNSAVKTATQSNGEQSVQHSVLSLCVQNVSKAYTMALAAMAEFAGAAGAKVEVALNSEFVELKLDAQMLLALIAAWQSGKFPESDLWAQLKKHGVIDPAKSDEKIKDELQTSRPAGPSLTTTE